MSALQTLVNRRYVWFVPDTSRAEKMIADLREYDAYLDTEKARIRPLLNAINGVETRTNTTEILQEMFLDNPFVEYTASEAEAELRERGWDTDSADPVNAVRAALARLKNSGEIQSVGRGKFLAAPGPEDNAPADDPWESKAPEDDPWGSAPAASSKPAVDDEPPF